MWLVGIGTLVQVEGDARAVVSYWQDCRNSFDDFRTAKLIIHSSGVVDSIPGHRHERFCAAAQNQYGCAQQ